MMDELMTAKVCPQCRKRFEVRFPAEWAYKRGSLGHLRYYCSWHCYRAAEPGEQTREQKRAHRFVPAEDVEGMVAMYKAGATVAEIGRRYNRYDTTVADILEREGVKEIRKRAVITPQEEQRIADVYRVLRNICDVAQVTKHTQYTVTMVLHRQGIETPRRGRGKDRRDPKKIEEVKRWYDDD